MERKYTASDFCCAANGLDAEPEDRVACIGPINDPSKHYAMVFRNHHIAEMLRQAADIMEREKKYEYAIKSLDCEISNISKYEDNVRECIDYINSDGSTGCKLVRREVGEWEEVDDVQQ